MEDVKYKLIKNCEVLNIYQKLPTLYNEYVIELSSKNKDNYNFDYHRIKIQSSKFYEELQKLKEDKIKRCYFVYYMADVDIYKLNNNYIIMNSPTEGFYDEYEISSKEFDKILNALK